MRRARSIAYALIAVSFIAALYFWIESLGGPTAIRERFGTKTATRRHGDTASMVLDLGTGDVSVTVNGELLFEVTDAAKFDGWSERHYENMLAYTLMFLVIESPALAQAPGEPCPDLVLIGSCITCAACAASPAAATPTCVSACSICSLCLIRQGFPQAVYKWLDSAAQIMQETNELHRRMGLIPPYSVGHCKL